MGRTKRGREIHGIVLLDKPAGDSSNRALQKVRRLYDARKAGHTGNLDPFATGMLPVCLGEATKTAAFMLDADKGYRARALLGSATSTGDAEGDVVRRAGLPQCDGERVASVLQGFVGELEQVPPMYSALKHEGTPLYRLARQGLRVERKKRTVEIRRIELVAWNPPELDFEVHCSKGTYVRTLAEDIGVALNSCAHLVALRRLFVEPFEEPQMVRLGQLESAHRQGALESCLLPVDAGLPGWPVLSLGDEAARAFRHGNPCRAMGPETGRVRVYGPGRHLLGLGEVGADGVLKPRRVFNIAMPGQARPERPEAPV